MLRTSGVGGGSCKESQELCHVQRRSIAGTQSLQTNHESQAGHSTGTTTTRSRGGANTTLFAKPNGHQETSAPIANRIVGPGLSMDCGNDNALSAQQTPPSPRSHHHQSSSSQTGTVSFHGGTILWSVRQSQVLVVPFFAIIVVNDVSPHAPAQSLVSNPQGSVIAALY